MMTQTALQFGEQQVRLWIPDPEQVKAQYYREKTADPALAFPHWTKLWPAAQGMARFIAQHPHYIRGKNVLELAAGLGLPSLVAATYANRVCCSDYLSEAVAVMQQSITLNQLSNVTCRVLNWFHLPKDLSAEVLLLSDINYDSEAFEQLYTIITGFLAQRATIILSTPQRLMAKPFIERLLPWQVAAEEMLLPENGQETAVSVFVLQAPH